MPDFEIRIRLTGTTLGYAQHVAWEVRRSYWQSHIEVEPPRLVNPPGSTIEQLPAEVLALIDQSDYLSTACETAFRVERASNRGRSAGPRALLAGWVDRLHDRCRLRHKFTGQPCACPCHQEAGR